MGSYHVDEEYVYDSNAEDDPFFLHSVMDVTHMWMTMEIVVSTPMMYSAMTVMIVTHLQSHTNPNKIMRSSLNPWHSTPKISNAAVLTYKHSIHTSVGLPQTRSMLP